MGTILFSVVHFISIGAIIALYGLGIAALIYFIRALRIYIRKNG